MTITLVFAINGTSSGDDERRSYAQYVNPIWVKLLDALGMIQSNVVEKAGTLARILCQAAGGKVSKASFCSSGSEGIERAEHLGMEFRGNLREALKPYEMVKEVRGEGMLSGVEFQAPRNLSMRMSFEAFKAVHPRLFGQVLVMRPFKDMDILTQICGNNFMVLKVAPPFTVNEAQLSYCVESIRSVVETIHSSSAFWLDALDLGGRAMSPS